jgi:ribosomal protein S27AE
MTLTMKCPRCEAPVVLAKAKNPVCTSCGWASGIRPR